MPELFGVQIQDDDVRYCCRCHARISEIAWCDGLGIDRCEKHFEEFLSDLRPKCRAFALKNCRITSTLPPPEPAEPCASPAMPAESYLEHCRDHCTNLVSLRQAIDRKTVAGIWLYCYCHHRATELVTAETEARRLNSENSPLCFTISTPGFIDFLYTTDRSDPILDNCQLTHSKSRIQ